MSDGDVEHYATFLAARTRRQDPTDQDRALVDTLLAELRLDGRLFPPGGVTIIEYGMADPNRPDSFPTYIGTTYYAEKHATHQRWCTSWIGDGPNDHWARYRTAWVEYQR